MKKYLIYLMMAAAIVTFGACSPEDENEPQTPDIENPEKPDDGGEDVPDDPDQPGDNPDTPNGDSKILVAYFSWGGTTQRMAQEIVRQTGADLFRINPVVPYPTEYTPCTEVALEEKNNDARPAIAATVENWEDYDTVFIGCPVWWWTTPMIICTFAESYDFKGKTVVPFCTYASTYRDETLARIVELTPDAAHLTGEGLTSGRINEQNISSWLREIGLIE
ncbi:flavodoxin [uncultured Bacteroides sp.]|uniref:flavodoxin n=1 Tax=uncultured Bacteroides sp. TaxID=162156 RepID=UPI00272C3EE5|nr:flavodoxin [uncultured Bacteroides sp.]